MAWYSIYTLRKHNKYIPIEILYICDKGRDNRLIDDKNLIDLKINPFCKDSFVESCQQFNVTFVFVYNLDMKEETGFHSLQRMAFQYVEDDQILLLDADTFLFGDVEPFFQVLRHNDVVLDLNAWGRYGFRLPYKGHNILSVNSGVVLLNKGILKEYGKQVYDLSMKIKGEDDPIGKWLSEYQIYEGTEGKLCREEIAFSLFLHDNKIKFRLSYPNEIQTNNIRNKTLIHHTQIQSYFRYWKKYYDKDFSFPMTKIKCKYFTKPYIKHEKEK